MLSRARRWACIHAYIHTYIHTYIHIHTHTYTHIHTHTHTHTYTYRYIHMCTCVTCDMYVCIFRFTYIPGHSDCVRAWGVKSHITAWVWACSVGVVTARGAALKPSYDLQSVHALEPVILTGNLEPEAQYRGLNNWNRVLV